ncbi:hypothetical protein [Spirosoma sp. 209]|uniref:hypothetical protein n=1 Tax=Spirosoma sp. 209 TaxID=1955701 RepID=UPI0011175E96|nr:hypothetical protein [Spirosoma sp. 209]
MQQPIATYSAGSRRFEKAGGLGDLNFYKMNLLVLQNSDFSEIDLQSASDINGGMPEWVKTLGRKFTIGYIVEEVVSHWDEIEKGFEKGYKQGHQR